MMPHFCEIYHEISSNDVKVQSQQRVPGVHVGTNSWTSHIPIVTTLSDSGRSHTT